MEEMRREETRLSTAVEDVKTKIQANSESSKAMLDYIITFSELVKNASLYFKYALDSEKHELITQIFSELSINDGELKYKAKEGFSALLARSDDNFPSFGSPPRARTHLFLTPQGRFRLFLKIPERTSCASKSSILKCCVRHYI